MCSLQRRDSIHTHTYMNVLAHRVYNGVPQAGLACSLQQKDQRVDVSGRPWSSGYTLRRPCRRLCACTAPGAIGSQPGQGTLKRGGKWQQRACRGEDRESEGAKIRAKCGRCPLFDFVRSEAVPDDYEYNGRFSEGQARMSELQNSRVEDCMLLYVLTHTCICQLFELGRTPIHRCTYDALIYRCATQERGPPPRLLRSSWSALSLTAAVGSGTDQLSHAHRSWGCWLPLTSLFLIPACCDLFSIPYVCRVNVLVDQRADRLHRRAHGASPSTR